MYTAWQKQTRLSAISDGSSNGPGNRSLFINMDFDDYYSLTEYASRFTADVDKYITLWFSQVSVISRIELWEKREGNKLFRESQIEFYVNKINDDELLDIEQVSKRLALESIFVEEGIVYGHRDVYYDFVGFMMSVGLVK